MAPEQPAYRVVGITEETRADFVEVDRLTWFGEEDPRDPDWSRCLDLDRSFAATPDGSAPYAGVYSSFEMTVTVPAPGGGLAPTPMAGLTWVGVHPDHRRRGVLSAMVEHHFRDLHERGEPLGGLHASETGIYGRFGYAVSALDAVLEVGRGAELQAPGGVDATGVSTRLATLSADGVARQVWELHRELAATSLGQVSRTWAHAQLAFTERVAGVRGAEPRRVLFAERSGRPVGYAILRRTPKWADGGPRGTMVCDELAAADPAALLVLVRRLVAFDLVTTVEIWGLPVDSPVIWWLGGPRACVAHTYDGVWLRLVDVGACLARRGYAAETDIVLDVADERCPWNARRWRLSTDSNGSAACTPTTDPADLEVAVHALAAVYTGGRTPGALAQQGLVTERRAGAVRALAAAVATPVAPHPGVMF